MKTQIEILNSNRQNLYLITYRQNFINDPFVVDLLNNDPYYLTLLHFILTSPRPTEYYLTEIALFFNLGSYQLARNLNNWITPNILYKSVKLTSFLKEDELPTFVLSEDTDNPICMPKFKSLKTLTKFEKFRRVFSEQGF